jgi:hypothetical protein
MNSIDIIIPIIREENRDFLLSSLIHCTVMPYTLFEGDWDKTYSENVNSCFKRGTSDWIAIFGDDCQFTKGWDTEAAKLSDKFDVIGTNDSNPGSVRNLKVSMGLHADHFFIRRSYVENLGSSLDGPGIVASEKYGHWYTDVEIIELAMARKTFTPCLTSVVIHHNKMHSEFRDRSTEELHKRAMESQPSDHYLWVERKPLVEKIIEEYKNA